jgi:hypothetical protein
MNDPAAITADSPLITAGSGVISMGKIQFPIEIEAIMNGPAPITAKSVVEPDSSGAISTE